MSVSNVRPHPGPLPQERERLCASLDNSSIAVAVAASLPFAPGNARQPASPASPMSGERFSLSLGERAGVRASVLQTNSSRL